MATSKLQRKTSSVLSYHFGEYTIRENQRPEWLIGPNGIRLEIDFVIEELKVAIEVQGVQHLEYTEYFHLTPQGYDNAKLRDKVKRELCLKYGYSFYEIFHEDEIMGLVEAIKGIKPESRVTIDKKFAQLKTAILTLKSQLELHPTLDENPLKYSELVKCRHRLYDLFHSLKPELDHDVIRYTTEILITATRYVNKYYGYTNRLPKE